MNRPLSPAFKPTFRPGYLAALAGVLIAALGGFAWYELHTSRQNTLETLEHSSGALVQAMARAGENALRAEEELDRLVQEHLFSSARSLARMQAGHMLSDSLLVKVAAEQGLARIEVFDPRGSPLYSSSPQPMDRFELDWWWEELAEVYEGTSSEHLVVLEAAELYAVATPGARGGAILVQASAQYLHELRRAAGIGRLIREIGANQGVVFTALQDSAGILMGSSGVGQLGTIAGDPFLSAALAGAGPVSRTAEFGGQEIFETVMPFAPGGPPLGLLRVGLSVEAVEAERRRDQLHLVLLAGLLAVLGAAGAGVLTIRQNYALLDEAYARMQTYSSRILAQMTDAVMAMDTAGRIEVLNQSAQALFGTTAAAATGRPYTEVVGAALPPVDRALQEGAEGQEGAQRYLVGGVERLLSLSTSLVRNSRGEVETVVVVAQDMTEMAALEADLRRGERLASMGALASGVAHEVRNPLNAIGIIAQRLEREFEPQRDQQEYRGLLKVVRGEVARVNRIVVDFLGLARPPALARRPVDLEEVVEQAVAAQEPRARAKGLRVERHYGGVGSWPLDPDQFIQAVQNLLSNAVEATQSGQIRVRTRRREDGGVEVEVEDSGEGIAPEHLEQIFDLYFTTKAEGTGLGLSLVHRIVNQHGGGVQVHSTPGAGSRFTLYFPASD
ncbi:MAG: PAS domain-containing protein [Candidatus Latescibacteria bacterium]|nr:PAS domain-containing protein [Candidatus Latescibacterota bacterium]